MKIQILIDNPNSWLFDYLFEFIAKLKLDGYQVKLRENQSDVDSGDILILLSCENIFRKLELNKHNLVIHESSLPKGKGWSPLTWQILEGNDKITVSLIEASEKVDSGNIYEQRIINFNGYELVSELRDKQAKATFDLIKSFIQKYPNNESNPQNGDSTYYSRRFPNDSKLDFDSSLREQFDLLRVCDNERYPAYFEIDGQKYILKIYKA